MALAKYHALPFFEILIHLDSCEALITGLLAYINQFLSFHLEAGHRSEKIIPGDLFTALFFMLFEILLQVFAKCVELLRDGVHIVLVPDHLITQTRLPLQGAAGGTETTPTTNYILRICLDLVCVARW